MNIVMNCFPAERKAVKHKSAGKVLKAPEIVFVFFKRHKIFGGQFRKPAAQMVSAPAKVAPVKNKFKNIGRLINVKLYAASG